MMEYLKKLAIVKKFEFEDYESARWISAFSDPPETPRLPTPSRNPSQMSVRISSNEPKVPKPVLPSINRAWPISEGPDGLSESKKKRKNKNEEQIEGSEGEEAEVEKEDK